MPGFLWEPEWDSQRLVVAARRIGERCVRIGRRINFYRRELRSSRGAREHARQKPRQLILKSPSLVREDRKSVV